MTKIKEILNNKGHQIWSIGPDASVYDAIHLMAEKEIGALLVMEHDKLLGVISERDYARQVILKGRSSEATQVKIIMTSEVITAGPEQTVDEGLGLMNRYRIRHLPIVEDEHVLGVISVGDLVNCILSEQQETIDQLGRYISG